MRAQIEKSCDLGKDVQDSGRVVHPIAHNRGNKPIIPDDVDTLTDDELSSSSSLPSLSLSLVKNARKSTKAKSCKRPSHHPAFSDVVSSASHKARREAGRRQNQPIQAPGNTSILLEGMVPPILLACMMPLMPLVHPAFGIGPMIYMPLAASIRRPDDMLSSPLEQHFLNYEPSQGFSIPTFATFDGSTNPYDHMLHYNKAMILNVGNDRLLCKVFPTSLRGPTIA